MIIETILTPAELPTLVGRDLSATACVVFDILRATSTFVTALHTCWRNRRRDSGGPATKNPGDQIEG